MYILHPTYYNTVYMYNIINYNIIYIYPTISHDIPFRFPVARTAWRELLAMAGLPRKVLGGSIDKVQPPEVGETGTIDRLRIIHIKWI